MEAKWLYDYVAGFERILQGTNDLFLVSNVIELIRTTAKIKNTTFQPRGSKSLFPDSRFPSATPPFWA